MHVFLKLVVWQHLAESVGCRQGPLMGHTALPCNLWYRLSINTLKLAKCSWLGDRRNLLDLLAHSGFYLGALSFVLRKEYTLWSLELLCACDVWIFLSDSTQFYASTGHAYFSVLLSGCFPEAGGRLAGMQLALILQWFFSGNVSYLAFNHYLMLRV